MKMKAIILVAAGFVLSLTVMAQTSRGTVSGIVTDSSGAVIGAATVTLTSSETEVSRATVTNEEGSYRFDAVDLGTYSIRIAAAMFSTVVKVNVAVSANQVAQVDTQLSPGNLEFSVDVTAEAGALLQTEVPLRGGNIDPLRISELPFSTRNPVSLALTLPGVSTNRFSFGDSTFSVNGARPRSNNFLIDGTEINDIAVTGQGLQIKNPDAVREVSVQTSNYDAEFGRAGGAVVNTITRSGTNAYHGTAAFTYDTTHDDAITNTQSLSPLIDGHPPYGTEQYFSGTIGGPVVHDKTFFFGAYQNQRQAATRTASIVSLAPAGRAQLRALFPVGASRNVDAYLTMTDGVDATSQFFNVPLANERPDIQFGTAVTFFRQTASIHQFQNRLDHIFGESDQISGRYLFDDQKMPIGGTTLGLPGFTSGQFIRNQNLVVAETHVFSPSLTNELRLSYGRLNVRLPLDPPNPLGLTQPFVTIAALTNLSGRPVDLGIPTSLPQSRASNNYIIQDTATSLHGKHTFRFGVDLLKQRSRQYASINERGSLSYQASSGFTAFANFVDDFGGTNGMANRGFGNPTYYPFYFRQAYFLQDQWRTTDALTLTLGLRYETFGNPINSLKTAAFTGLFNVNPATLDGPYSQPNKLNEDRNNFAPAIGLAYSLSRSEGVLGRIIGERKTVVRAGYHLGYDSFFNNIASNAASQSPNIVAISTVSGVTTAAPRGLANFSAALPVIRPLLPFDNQTLVDPNLVNPYYQRWSLGVQRELPGNFIADASYVGSKGSKLYLSEDRNPLVPAAMRVTPVGYSGSATGRLDNLQGARTIRSNSGSSSYEAGQLQVIRRSTNGTTVSGSYTYSKLIDNGSDIAASPELAYSSLPITPHIFGGERNDRAVSLFDRTHRASFTYVYELPFMREQRGALGHIAGGWQISGVTAFESGVPFTVANGVDSNGVGGNNDRPDFNPAGEAGVRAAPVVDATGTITGYVNPDAGNAPIDPATARYIGLPVFSAAQANSRQRTGTLGRNTERTRGINNFDVAILKRIVFTESVNIELRADFFNIFNHPQYSVRSVSPFAPQGSGPSATVIGTPAGSFLNAQTGDGGGRVIYYQLKLRF